MGVTGAISAEREANLRQIDKLASSSILHGSESLCKLLHYLAEQAMENPGVAVKEFQIATEVFGRPHDFDPRLDSTVRVQTGRLRSKLAEYYAGAGAGDGIIVEVPKGAYAVTFHPRRTSLPAAAEVPAFRPEEPAVKPVPLRKPTRLMAALVVVSALLLSSIVIIAFLLGRTTMQGPVPASGPANETFRAFWKSFVDQTEDPLVVFSNAEFTGRPETGMRYFDPKTDSRDAIRDHYSGVGEVIGIHELDRLFNSVLGHGLRVKRGRLLSLDDAKNNDVIFVGSPSENLSLLEVPTSKEFLFRRIFGPVRRGDLAIVNVRPKQDEKPIYFASEGTLLTEDYSIIALVPGMNQAHQAMLLAGITTIGTQAAVEFVCRKEGVEEILRRLTGSKTGPVSPFEAVLRVKVSRGVPVASDIVAFHRR